jgi:RNA polymerase sigma-70 factor, ECF subfamily
MSDSEIIQRILAGDAPSFRIMVERYHRKIVGMIFHLTRDHHLSEDLCQDVFIDAYRHLAQFDPARAQFSTWVYRIAQNKTLNALKKKRPLFFAELPETSGTSNVHHEVEANELHAELDHALALLPPNQRIAFVWAEIEQLSHQEIAEIEGTTATAIKSRINRARQQIQAALKRRRPLPNE